MVYLQVKGHCLKPWALILIVVMSLTVMTIYIQATKNWLNLHVPVSEVIVRDSAKDLQTKATKNLLSNNKHFVPLRYPATSKTRNLSNEHHKGGLPSRTYEMGVADTDDSKGFSQAYTQPAALYPHNKPNDFESTNNSGTTTLVTSKPDISNTSEITTIVTITPVSTNISEISKPESAKHSGTTTLITRNPAPSPRTTTVIEKNHSMLSNILSSNQSSVLLPSSAITSSKTLTVQDQSQQLRDDEKPSYTENGKFNAVYSLVFHNETNTNESNTTFNKTKDSYAVLQQIHKERIQTIQITCKNRELFDNNPYHGKHETVIYMTNKYTFSYCKVPKSGSTFWTQAFGVLEYGINYGKTVFSKPRESVHFTTNKYSVSFKKVQTSKTPTVLVSRDPYSRLYSAYIDKSFLPLMFSINYTIRKRTSNQQCPTNVTFEEFLDWIIIDGKRGATLNPHWTPIVSLCRPCDINAVILVKQETFSSDVEFALKQLQVDEDKFKYLMSALHDHRAEFTLPGIIATAYGRMKNREVRSCLTYPSLARRIWTSFQIQGFIDETVSFPEQKFVLTNRRIMESSYLSDIVLETIREYPLSSQQSKQQRHRYLYNAYGSIRLEIIEDIQDLYNLDFEIFGYSKIPPIRDLLIL